MKFEGQFLREYLVQHIRDFFIALNYHETEIPVLAPMLPLEHGLDVLCAHAKHLDKDFYLIPYPESYIKQLIAQGMGNCFYISKCIRELENISPTHNLEFHMLEWYEIGGDYKTIADTTEKLIKDWAKFIEAKTKIKCQYNLQQPFAHYTLKELFQKHANMDLSKNLTLETIRETAIKKGYNVDGVTDWEPIFSQIMFNEIESKLDQSIPTMVFDFPTQISALCELCPDSPGFSQRFEIYIGGKEIGNAYTESTKADELEQHFKEELEFRTKNNLPIHPYDTKLIEATRNLPACGGMGLGVERLAMTLGNYSQIGDVLYFPTCELVL